PSLIDITNRYLDQPKSPSVLNPYNLPPKPIFERITDKISGFGFFCSVTFVSKQYAAIISIVAIGNTTYNTLRQGSWSTDQPQKRGPIGGANAMTSPTIPTAVPRLPVRSGRNRRGCMTG